MPEHTREFGAEQALPLLAKLEEARHVLTLNAGEEGSDDLRKELNQCVRREIGALAAPERKFRAGS